MSAPKKQAEKVATLKGQEAENVVLDYLKSANRPYGAADVSANIKNVVSKSNTQKILIALAEQGKILQKTYGKMTFFVADQGDCEDMSDVLMDAFEAEAGIIADQNTELSATLKSLTSELQKVRSGLSTTQLTTAIQQMQSELEGLESLLLPLRAGSSLICEEEVARLDSDWESWRAHWVARKKKFIEAWSLITESISTNEATELAEDLGIEFDSPEHVELEKSELCQLKRRRK